MRAYLRIMLVRLDRHVLAKLILIAELFLLIFGCYQCTGIAQHYIKNARMAGSVEGLSDALYWYPDEMTLLEPQAEYVLDCGKLMRAAKRYIAEDGTFEACGIYSVETTIDREMKTRAHIFAYDDELIRRIRLPMKAGEWFGEGGEPQVVVDSAMARRFPLGSTFIFIDSHHNALTGEFEAIEHSARVIGVYDMDGALSLLSGGGMPSLDMIFCEQSVPTVIFRRSDAGFLPEDTAHPGLLLYPQPGASGTQVAQASERLNRLGSAATIAQMYANSLEKLRSRVGYILPQDLLLIITALLGVISSALLTEAREGYENAVYYICGARRGRLALVTYAQYLLMFLLASIPAALHCYGAPGTVRYSDTFLIGWLIALALTALSATLPHMSRISLAPASIIRRAD